MQRKTRLFYRGIKSIGIVDVGANEGADILVAKRKEPAPVITDKQRASKAAELRAAAPALAAKMDDVAQTYAQIASTEEARREVNDMIYRFQNSACSILRDATVDQPALLQQSATEFLAAFMARISSWAGNASEKVGAKISAANMAKIKAAMAALEELMTTVEGQIMDDDKKSIEAPAADDSLKGLPEEVRKRLEVAEKAIADAKAEAEVAKADAKAAQESAKIERDSRVTGEWVAKVKADMPRIAAPADTFGAVLKRAEEALSAEDFAELTRVLKAASAAINLAPIGSDSTADATSASAQIEAAAADLLKDGSIKHIAAARVEARKRNPKLAEAERIERDAVRH